MTTILVLGSTGMLGHAVADELEWLNHDVVRSSRCIDHLYLSNKNMIHVDALNISTLKNIEGCYDYVINCVGCIKQRYNDATTLARVNSLFPHLLNDRCNEIGAKLIHVTTDCVFSGKKGSYDEHDEHDVDDEYGRSKSLGEPPCMVLRTSLVGLELQTSYSLMGWAISQRGKHVEGYKNHLWNGITNVQFGKICHKIIKENWYEIGKKHVFSPEILTKHDMLVKFNEKFDLKLDIIPELGPHDVNRSLQSLYDLNVRLEIPSFNEQLRSL